MHCRTHHFEPAVAGCRDCGHHVCGDCLVTVPRVGALCVQCALARAGVRSRRRVSVG